jgi:hypothetical protein
VAGIPPGPRAILWSRHGAACDSWGSERIGRAFSLWHSVQFCWYRGPVSSLDQPSNSTSQAICEQFARRRHSIRADVQTAAGSPTDAAGPVTDASHMSSRTAPSQLLGPRARNWIQRLPRSCESAARLRDPFNHYELALAAPREEIGREIRGVAVSFPQVGFFLWRVGIRLHHLPVQMPGGMTEHRQNDGETDEGR